MNENLTIETCVFGHKHPRFQDNYQGCPICLRQGLDLARSEMAGYRAAVAAALAELRVQAETGAEKWFGHHNEANIYQDFIESISATIAKLGLQEERDD